MLTGSDEYWMEEAIAEASRASGHGDVPIGCVVVDAQGQRLAIAHNRREVDADPTAHAEILAMRQACGPRGHWRLHDCTLYVTLEPCFMCAGAMVNARLGRLVFGASDAKAGAIHSLQHLSQDERLNHRFDFQAGVCKQPCVDLLQQFFRALRAQGKK